jgi:ion channel-forming bestrophin family protein
MNLILLLQFIVISLVGAENHSPIKILQKAAIQDFHSDLSTLQSLPRTSITTPCHIKQRDSTYTKLWSFDDWERHQSHSILRYFRHMATWSRSTTVHNIIPTIAADILWCIVIFKGIDKKKAVGDGGKLISKYAVTLTFMQAPILLLLTLRTNRALDRMLESRTSWGMLSRTTKSLMGLTCAYILPHNPQVAMIMARHLAFIGWSLKSMLRKDDDDSDMMAMFTSVPAEREWLSNATGKRPNAIVARLRYLIAELGKDPLVIPPVVLLRFESILYDLESCIGTCVRLFSSPIPPTYTRHTSRVLVCYMFLLPFALSKSL